MSYIRNDIEYCPCCGEFRQISSTGKKIAVPYTDMPAEFALKVMTDRQRSEKGRKKRRTRKRFDNL